MKKNKEILDRFAALFGVDSVEIVRSPCFGKWRGTTDYSLKIGDSLLSIGNSSAGQKFLDDRLAKMLGVYENFIAKKSEILEKIEILRAADNKIAAEMNLKQYRIIDLDFAKSGNLIGWFYISLDVSGTVFNLVETGLNYEIREFLKKNREFSTSEKYYTAGGLHDSQVNFIFRGVGFSTIVKMYTL